MRRSLQVAAMATLACAMLAGPAARAETPWTAPIFRGPKTPKPAPPVVPAFADVEAAEQLYGKLEFDDANKVADRVLKQRGLSHDQLVRAYKILATTHAFLDHEDPARDAFILLMTYEPDYQVDPNQGPKVTTPFFEARGFWRSQPTKPGIEVVATVRMQDGGVLRVTTRDPTHIIKKVSVGYRWATSGDYVPSTVSIGNSVQVDLPSPPPGKSRLEYYAQALDDRDDVAFETGNPAAPKSAVVETQPTQPPPPPIGTSGSSGNSGSSGSREGGDKSSGGGVLSSPVFWVIASAVVVGGAAGAFFVLRGKDTAAPTQASLTPLLNCGGTRCN